MNVLPLSEILDNAHGTLAACAGFHGTSPMGQACADSARDIEAYLKGTSQIAGSGPSKMLPLPMCVGILDAASKMGCATMMFSRSAADGGVIQTIIVIANDPAKAEKLHGFARKSLGVAI